VHGRHAQHAHIEIERHPFIIGDERKVMDELDPENEIGS
jgi:hypothetical protein